MTTYTYVSLSPYTANVYGGEREMSASVCSFLYSLYAW